MNKILLIVFLSFVSQISFAQNLYTKRFSDSSLSTQILATKDGNAIILTALNADSSGFFYPVITKVDGNSSIIWSKIIKINYLSSLELNDLVELKNADLLICGISDDSLCILKLSEKGETLWSKKYTYHYPAHSLIASLSEQESMVLIDKGPGFTFNILKINNGSGSVVWSKEISSVDFADVRPTIIKRINDSSVVVGGDVSTPNLAQGFFMKVDFNGNIISSKKLITSTLTSFKAAAETYDGNLIFVSDIWSGEVIGNDNILLYEITKTGKPLFSKMLSCENGLLPKSIIRTNDSGYLVSGYSYSTEVDTSKPFLIKLSKEKELQWSQKLCSQFFDIPFTYVSNTKDNIFLANYFYKNYYTSILQTIDQYGNSCCSKKIILQEDSTVINTESLDWTYSTISIDSIDQNNVISDYSPGLTTLCSSVLPLHLLSFTAQHNGASNLLQWSATEEFNTDRFEIQRSKNGKDFTAIGNVHALNNGKISNAYTFTDAQPLKQINYYRLKMFDKDGKYIYSPVRNINNTTSFNVTLFPNPVKDILTLNFNAVKNQDLQIDIVNAEDKKVYTQKLQLTVGAYTQKINIASLHAGIYFIQCTTADGATGLKFVKQ